MKCHQSPVGTIADESMGACTACILVGSPIGIIAVMLCTMFAICWLREEAPDVTHRYRNYENRISREKAKQEAAAADP